MSYTFVFLRVYKVSIYINNLYYGNISNVRRRRSFYTYAPLLRGQVTSVLLAAYIVPFLFSARNGPQSVAGFEIWERRCREKHIKLHDIWNCFHSHVCVF